MLRTCSVCVCVIGSTMQPVLSFLFNSCLPIREGHVWGKEIVKGNMSSFRQFPLILISVLGWQGPDWDVSHGDLTLYISQVLVLKVLIICSPNLEDMMSNNLTGPFFVSPNGWLNHQYNFGL